MEREIPPESFVLGYLSSESHQIETITVFDLADLSIARMEPVRIPRNFRGQKHKLGYYWFSKSRIHIKYESRLELFAYQLLDFDLNVRKILPQPLVINFFDGYREHHHVPDILCERKDLPNLLIDVKPKKFVTTGRNQIAFKFTEMTCSYAGWDYEVWSEPQRSLYYNLRLLASYRRPPIYCDLITPKLVSHCQEQARSIEDLIGAFDKPYFTRPVLFHLLWKQILTINLEDPIQDTSIVSYSRHDLHG